MLLIIALSTFVCISLVMMGAYWLLARPQSAATQRLKKLGEKSAGPVSVSLSMGDEGGVADFAERLASPLNRLVPASAAEVRKLQKQVMQAGFRSKEAPFVFLAILLTTMVGFRFVVPLVDDGLGCVLYSPYLWDQVD